jgi:hypothetical protein
MQMYRKALEAIAREAAKGIKPPQDLNCFSRMLKKITVEALLNVEMDEHLGYEKHAKSVVKKSRDGMTSKRIKTEDGEFDLTHHVIVMALLSLSWSKRISPDLHLWMRKFFCCMLKA